MKYSVPNLDVATGNATRSWWGRKQMTVIASRGCRAMVQLTALAMGLAMSAVGTVSATEPPKLAADDLRRLALSRVSDFQLVDVRSPADYAQAHIQGARNVPAATIERAALPKEEELVVYCGGGTCPLSHNAAELLLKDGYTDVKVLDGGFSAWVAKGYPVVSGEEGAKAKLVERRAGAAGVRAGLEKGGTLAVDVRTAAEFSAGHLPGAVNFPLESLGADWVRLPKGKTLIVYDRQQSRMTQAVEELEKQGLEAQELSGGVAGWVAKGYALEVK